MVVSKADEGELLIYKSDGEGGFINIIIDNSDLPIEIFHVKKNRQESWHKMEASVDEVIDFWNKFAT